MTGETPNLEVGDRLPPVTRRVTQDKMNRFEIAGRALKSEGTVEPAPINIHTSPERAREMGLSRPIASGQMSFAYLHELLARRFGADFRQGGRLSVTFLKPVYDGDVVTAQGIVIKKEKAGHRTKLLLQVWVENQDGERTAAGEAEVIIPSPLT